MTIKTIDGQHENVASSAAVNTATTLGAVGLGLSLLNGNGGILGNVLGGNRQSYVSKEEFDLGIQLAKKDSEIALLQAKSDIDTKLVDVFKEAAARDRDIRDLIAVNKAEQAAINAQQMAWNATANTQMATMAANIASQAQQLAEITTSVVPSRKVCDTGCGCN